VVVCSTMRRGFTLIELLVVIAIIAILAAILFPVFARAREKARQTACLNNVKQLMLGIMMYVQDYDERYPFVYNYGTTQYWSLIIGPYVMNNDVYKCPSSSKSGSMAKCYNYAINVSVMRYGPSPPESGNRVAMKLGEVKQPAHCMAMVDGYKYAYPGGYVYAYVSGGACGRKATDVDSRFGPDAAQDYERGRHNGGVNIGFCDGHAKWLHSHDLCGHPEYYDPNWDG